MMNYIYILLISVIALGCDKTADPNINISNCDEQMIIDVDKFDGSISYVPTVLDINYDGECLQVKIGYSGCESDHEMKIYNDGSIDESNPIQTTIIIEDQNPEPCLAYFEKTFSFGFQDVPALNDNEAFILKISGTDQSFLIEK